MAVAATDARAWSARCSGSTLLEFLLLGPANGPLPRGALFEIRRVLERRRIQWSLPRHRNLLILACERGVDLAVVDCLLRAFYRQRRLALFDGTRKLLVADREAALWAAGSAPATAAAACCGSSSLSILARLFLLDNVDFHERGSSPLHLPVLLAAVRSLDDAWALQVLLHERIAPAIAHLAVPSAPVGLSAVRLSVKTSSESRRRLWRLQTQRPELGFFIECVRVAIKARMDQVLTQLEAINAPVTRAVVAYCAIHSPSPIGSGGDESRATSRLVKRFHRDLLWRQVGGLVLARMESARRRKRSVWRFLRPWGTADASHTSDELLVVLPDGLFQLIVSFLSVTEDVEATMAALALHDGEDR